MGRADVNHQIIYLEPVCPDCGADPDEGRLWCEDDVWDKICGGCGGNLPPPARYMLVEGG